MTSRVPTSLRLALVAHRLAGHAPTGIGRYYEELVRHLAEPAVARGHTLVAASTRETVAADWLPSAVERIMLPGPRKAFPVLWSLTGRPHVDGLLREPHVVHVLHPWAPVPVRTRLVVTIHDLIPWQHPEWFTRAASWMFHRGVLHARDHAAAIVTVSAHVGRELTQGLGIEPSRIHVVHNGIGDEFRGPHDPSLVAAVARRHGVEPGRYLLTVGQMGDRKNQAVLVEALARVDPRLLGTPALLVAGPPSVGADRVERRIEALGLAERVRLAGFVPSEDLAPLVAGARALVHPSRSEGFGFTPLEAMAAGVPAVAAATSSIPEVCGDAAVLIEADDVDGWASAIERVATDADHRTGLIDRGSRRADRFRWGVAATKTLEVLEAAAS